MYAFWFMRSLSMFPFTFQRNDLLKELTKLSNKPRLSKTGSAYLAAPSALRCYPKIFLDHTSSAFPTNRILKILLMFLLPSREFSLVVWDLSSIGCEIFLNHYQNNNMWLLGGRKPHAWGCWHHIRKVHYAHSVTFQNLNLHLSPVPSTPKDYALNMALNSLLAGYSLLINIAIFPKSSVS